jgi:hypothetical protein
LQLSPERFELSVQSSDTSRGLQRSGVIRRQYFILGLQQRTSFNAAATQLSQDFP